MLRLFSWLKSYYDRLAMPTFRLRGCRGDCRFSDTPCLVEILESRVFLSGTTIVAATDNIFGAGHSVVPNPGGHGGGTMPELISFAAGAGRELTFDSVVGQWWYDHRWELYHVGPDGGGGNLDLSSYGGISGITNPYGGLFLTGVFLTDAEPVTAPSRLSFSQDFTVLSPEIGQSFYIGDGRSNTNAVQHFNVPANATRLFLGTVDGAGFSGVPDFYDGNTGSVTANYKISEKIDLQLAINDAMISPSKATDLHLNQFFGGESVRVPIAIQNIGTEPARGTTTLEVYLSTTSDLTGIVAGPFRKHVTVSLAASGLQTAFVDVTFNAPVKLKAGDKYYFVAKLTSQTIQESDAKNGIDKNNVAASATQYQYVGIPSPLLWPNPFDNGKYFNVIRDTLKSVNPFSSQGVSVPTSGQRFTAAFESHGGYDNPNLGPYLDSKNIATIGIGINLIPLSKPTNSNDKATRDSLATAVKAFYRSQASNGAVGYSNIDSKTNGQVVAMLINQALLAGHRRKAQNAFTAANAQTIFDAVYNTHAARAAATVGQVVWDSLPQNVRWVLVDINFNVGSLKAFVNLLSDIRATGGPNLIRAGFDFFDSQRTLDVQYPRTLAGFQFLVDGHTCELGVLI